MSANIVAVTRPTSGLGIMTLLHMLQEYQIHLIKTIQRHLVV